MLRKSLLRWLVVFAAVDVILLIALFAGSDDAHRETLRSEAVKGLIQLLVVVLFGAALKLVVDRYQEQLQRDEQNRQLRQDKAEQNRQFRQDKYDRLVEATNQLRRAWTLIGVNRSVKTWNEQMLAVIDAGLTLRMIKHQIYSSRDLDPPPFPQHTELVTLFEKMYRYTDQVVVEFAAHKKELSELQRQAEEVNLPAGERARRQEEVWKRIQALPSFKDKHGNVPAEEQRECQEPLERAVEESGAQPSSDRLTTSWLDYEEAESQALELITQTTFDESRRSQVATQEVPAVNESGEESPSRQ